MDKIGCTGDMVVQVHIGHVGHSVLSGTCTGEMVLLDISKAGSTSSPVASLSASTSMVVVVSSSIVSCTMVVVSKM